MCAFSARGAQRRPRPTPASCPWPLPSRRRPPKSSCPRNPRTPAAAFLLGQEHATLPVADARAEKACSRVPLVGRRKRPVQCTMCSQAANVFRGDFKAWSHTRRSSKDLAPSRWRTVIFPPLTRTRMSSGKTESSTLSATSGNSTYTRSTDSLGSCSTTAVVARSQRCVSDGGSLQPVVLVWRTSGKGFIGGGLITLLSSGGVWNEMESGGIAKHRSNAAVHGRWSEDKQRTEHCLWSLVLWSQLSQPDYFWEVEEEQIDLNQILKKLTNLRIIKLF